MTRTPQSDIASHSTAPAPADGLADALVELSFAVQALLGARADDAGLTLPQVRLLGILRDREPTINELAAHIGLDKSSMSGLVSRAERNGLVRRVRDRADRRSIRVHLEPHGRETIEKATTAFAQDVRALAMGLRAGELREWTRLSRSMLQRAGLPRPDRYGRACPPSARDASPDARMSARNSLGSENIRSSSAVRTSSTSS